jgi:hypothetical protein
MKIEKQSINRISLPPNLIFLMIALTVDIRMTFQYYIGQSV